MGAVKAFGFFKRLGAQHFFEPLAGFAGLR